MIPNPVPLFARISFGALVLIISAYMMNESHKLVIDPVDHTFVDYGVFSRARHPMYLGIVLTYFALSVATFSAASFVLWLIYFIIYERFAAFEEHELVEVLVET